MDYATSMERLHDVVDGFVVNVSSPNTPNLRDLQHEEALKGLLEGLALRLDGLNSGHSTPGPCWSNSHRTLPRTPCFAWWMLLGLQVRMAWC